MKRSAGILLPVSSLPSPYGIGCFDSAADRFVDFLKRSGQSYWQILPLGPTGYGNSPYQTFSTFAGNPYFIDPEALIAEDLLSREDCERADLTGDPSRVDYGRQYSARYPLLKKAYEKSRFREDPDFEAFCAQNPWLEAYTLFMAIKEAHHGASLMTWEDELRLRDPDALSVCRKALADQIGFHAFLQYYFFRQWDRVKQYANENGVRIIGDIPIYVAMDSVDVWTHPELFQMDTKGRPIAVAGCPPDGFSAEGQLWGNPLYDWKAHENTGYAWWIQRMAHSFKLYDVVRIDHFRGFDEYYAIPYGADTAREGHWEKGPGMALFTAVRQALGEREIIAEDLGFVTDSVRRLVTDSGFPGMKVLEFGFDTRDTSSRNEHLPHTYPENCVAYTGTHDNQTLSSWFSAISEEERDMVRAYLEDVFTPPHALNPGLIALIMRSQASLCMVPMQDWLGLGDESRMNTPSTAEKNWEWRMGAGSAGDSLARKILCMTRMYGR